MVDKIFPPFSNESSEEDGGEDFNDFYYWRPSIPDISTFEDRHLDQDENSTAFNEDFDDKLENTQEVEFAFI